MNTLWKNINLCFMVFSLSCLIIKGTDTSSVSNLGCKIKKVKPLSPDCHDRMVNPYSPVNRNCLIKKGGTTLGKTWEQVNNILKAKSALLLKLGNLRTRIYLTRPLEATYRSASPRTLYSNQTRKLSCHFKGLPIPRVVWYKDDKAVITDGTNGFYHTEKLFGDHQNTLEASLYIPGREENEGFYTCTANNSICGRPSDPLKSHMMQVIYQCPVRIDTKDSKIETIVFSNSTLRCLVQDQHDLCDLEWFFNNKMLPSKSNDKYKVELMATPSKCKKEFSLTVMNVTFVDEGTYSCHQFCAFQRWFNFSASIRLNVGTSPRRRNEITQSVLERSKAGDRLVISYSSKDSAWVAENVIRPLLDEHSVNYELQQSINATVVDSVLYRSRQMLIVLSKGYLANNLCRMSDSRVILVSIGKITESQSQSLSCLGKMTLLEFEEQKKQDWQKSLLDAVLSDTIVRL